LHSLCHKFVGHNLQFLAIPVYWSILIKTLERSFVTTYNILTYVSVGPAHGRITEIVLYCKNSLVHFPFSASVFLYLHTGLRVLFPLLDHLIEFYEILYERNAFGRYSMPVFYNLPNY
jgi:hypothetical protein